MGIKNSKIENGVLIQEFNSGHIVKTPVQTEKPKETAPKIKMSDLAQEEINMMILIKLGYEVEI